MKISKKVKTQQTKQEKEKNRARDKQRRGNQLHPHFSFCTMHLTLTQGLHRSQTLSKRVRSRFISLIAPLQPFWLWKAEVHEIKIDALCMQE